MCYLMWNPTWNTYNAIDKMNHVIFDKKNLFFEALGWCSIDRCDEMDGWCFHHKLAIYIHRAIQITKVALSTLHIINYIPKAFEIAKVDTPYLTLNDLGFPTQDVHESLREFWGRAAVVVIHDLNPCKRHDNDVSTHLPLLSKDPLPLAMCIYGTTFGPSLCLLID